MLAALSAGVIERQQCEGSVVDASWVLAIFPRVYGALWGWLLDG